MNAEQRTAIERLGVELVACRHRCEGVACDQGSGALPRCLVVEERSGGMGAIMVGINPGHADVREVEYYRAHGSTYSAVVDFFNQHVGFRHQYYLRLRKFADALGLKGSILWTELAKCENAPDMRGLLPLQTLRKCSSIYLRRELQSVPSDWVIVGVGGEAYKALAYLYPERAVIGVPHPTGARGTQWHGLFDSGALHPKVLSAARAAISSNAAVWLGESGRDR